MNVCSYTRDIEQVFVRTLFRIERMTPMELSLNTKAMPALFSNVSKATRQLLQPFFQAPTSEANVQAFIMPMDHVLDRLHQHYEECYTTSGNIVSIIVKRYMFTSLL